MGNPYCCETNILLDGVPYSLKMTLGALAALESKLDVSDLNALMKKFDAGLYSAKDLIEVINAGLYGSGHPVKVDEKTVQGGAVKAAEVAMFLLTTTFAVSPNELW